jgi:hypothetical protein
MSTRPSASRIDGFSARATDGSARKTGCMHSHSVRRAVLLPQERQGHAGFLQFLMDLRPRGHGAVGESALTFMRTAPRLISFFQIILLAAATLAL